MVSYVLHLGQKALVILILNVFVLPNPVPTSAFTTFNLTSTAPPPPTLSSQPLFPSRGSNVELSSLKDSQCYFVMHVE